MADRRYTGYPGGVGIMALIAAVCLLAACQEKESFVPPPASKVTVSQPSRKVVRPFREYTGNTQAVNTVQLVARVQGYLEKVLFQDGDIVKKGQLLFVIQQNTYEAKLQQAEANLLSSKAQLDHAETEFGRFSNLFQQKAASATDVSHWRYERDSARAAVNSYQAQLELARLDLGYTKVTAPFDGRMDRRLKDCGNLVGAGENTVLAEINQIDPLYVYFTVNERDVLRTIEKQRTLRAATGSRLPDFPIRMGLASEDGYPHEGRLDFASITLNPQTGTLLLRGVFPNPGGAVMPGMFARVRISSVSEVEALLIPELAVGTDQLGRYVLIVNDKKIVERRGIYPGAFLNGMRVIEKGLQGDEWVITNGQIHAIPGREVDPLREEVQETSSKPQT